MRARGARRHARWAVPLGAVLLVLMVPGVADAHVTLHPDRVARGATDVELTFRCPNERDDATVALAVYLPTSTPLLGVLTDPPPGWSASVHTVRLAHPVVTDDGEVGAAVDEVAWRATGAGIPPGQYEDFSIAVGTMPDTTGTLTFKALQTYRDGTVVRWIQVPDALDEDPPTPAPTLTLYASSGTGTSTALWLSVAALVLAVMALVGVVATRRSRRSAASREGSEVPLR
jgi:uncharacterized protein YcnI